MSASPGAAVLPSEGRVRRFVTSGRTRTGLSASAMTASGRSAWVAHTAANLVGAVGAAYFARAGLRSYLRTHRLIGAVFLAEQTWVVVAYLVRRPTTAASRRAGDWLLAFGGTFGVVLLRPDGAHPHWGVNAGLAMQVVGVVVALASFWSLGRSFGFAAADRGLASRGTYLVVRHPIYASYLLVQFGYVLQSISLWNVLVVVAVTSCNVGRALVEERVLAGSEQYDAYHRHVPWRLLPGVW